VKTLKTALFPYIHTSPLLDHEVQVPDVELDVVSMRNNSPRDLFREMTREAPYDVSEMGIAVAIAAKEYGLPFTAIPIFPVRRFDYHVMRYNTELVTSPKDLEGKKVAGGSLQTDVDLHCMDLLENYFDVDLDSISWVATGDNHLQRARPPKNSEAIYGASVTELLDSGEVAACVAGYSGSSGHVKQLVEDIEGAKEYWLTRNGFTPLHHTVVIRNDVLQELPELAHNLVLAFEEAKQPFLRRINNHEDVWEEMSASVVGPAHDFGVTRQADLRLPDPVPYGIDANRGAIESLIRISYDRGYLSKAWEPEELFTGID
jgi:4,5-dihydroxyphthalate decarboxylase